MADCRFKPIVFSKSSFVISRNPPIGAAPTQFTKISIVPNFVLHSEAKFSISSLRVISQGMPIESIPSFLNSSTVFSTSMSSKLETTTLAPCIPMACAMALPIPELEPVIKAVLPDKSNKLLMNHFVSKRYAIYLKWFCLS